MNVFAWSDTAFLFVVAVAAVLHLNDMRSEPWFERLGFALVGGGAAGGALEYWWPGVNDAVSGALLHLGLAMVAAAWLAGKVRAWNGVERRRAHIDDRFIQKRFGRGG